MKVFLLLHLLFFLVVAPLVLSLATTSSPSTTGFLGVFAGNIGLFFAPVLVGLIGLFYKSNRILGFIIISWIVLGLMILGTIT